MKIVDAFWEKRNLGVDTTEITIEISDTVSQVQTALETLCTEYQVVKIPAGMIDLMWLAEKNGFHYIETSIHVIHNLKNLTFSPLVERLNKKIQYEPMKESEKDELYKKIKKGMFYTDRIYLDPFFSDVQAANRYIGWIEDEQKKGSELFQYLYKDQKIGFFTFKQIENNVYYPFLAGIYPEYQKNVFGAVYIYKPLIEAKKRNGKMISTYISTNNSNAVRMHIESGFQFREVTYVYVKHKKVY